MKSIRKKIKRKNPKNKTKCYKHKHNKDFFCPYCNKMMKGGCSCNSSMLGGNDVARSLAYTGNTQHYDKNPYLAYTGKTDTNVIYPDVTGPASIKMDWLNSLKSGGSNSGNYPNGLIGNDWNPNYQYPNVLGTTNNNHYKLNTYAPNDISRNTILSGSSKPFSIGGKKRRSKMRRQPRRNTQKRKIGGGYFQTPSSILNNMSYNLGKYTSNLQGINEPPNPLPFQDQFKGSLNNLKIYR